MINLDLTLTESEYKVLRNALRQSKAVIECQQLETPYTPTRLSNEKIKSTLDAIKSLSDKINP